MLSVGMMREGDKLNSYKLIARTLEALPSSLEWELDIAGDGPAYGAVEALMEPFGQRVRLHGALDPIALAKLYSHASLLLWPGVNEAFGLTYLEAQAAGVPVVAQDRPGVRDVVYAPLADVEAGPSGLAAEVLNLTGNLNVLRDIGGKARARVAECHLATSATRALNKTLESLT